ncbi:MAG: GDP-mannose 4,6-dehydratase, partial [Gammaproteobacteria bacterium]
HLPKRPGEPDCTFADISKIQKNLDWNPKVSFDEGIQSMLKAIHEWNDAPLWDVESIHKATRTWFDYLGRELV